MKKLIFIALAIIILSCSDNSKSEFSLTDHVPENTEIFIASKNLKESLAQLEANSFLKESSFPLKKNIAKQLAFLEYLKLDNPVGISFSGLSGKTIIFSLVTRKDSGLVRLDSVKNRSVETIKEGGLDFQKIELNGNSFFILEKENASYISNSRQKILDIGHHKRILENESFNKAFSASDPEKLSVFINHSINDEISGFFENFSFPGFKNYANWSVMDLDINSSSIKVNGISLSGTKTELLNGFIETNPRNIESVKVCPEEFISLSALGYNSFEKLHANLKTLERDSTQTEYAAVLDQTREIALIKLQPGNATVLNTVEIEAAKELLAGMGETYEIYRESEIIELETPFILPAQLAKLLTTGESNFYTIIEHFIIFSEEIEVLKKILTDFQNSDIIVEKSYFNNLIGSLSSESSVFFLAGFPEFIKNEKASGLKFNKNSLGALQFVHEGNFAHIHGIFSNSKEAALASNGAEQIASFKLDHALVTDPIFFKNHRTDQMDIAVQDENNQIFLISNKGTVFWKKQLDSQITSPVYQVDLFKNGNQQLAFSTGYNFEVLDRNGNKVKGFPIKFNSPLTQPLSVFDYDNNRNYRFVLTQDKRLYMVGPKGKAIKGFDFDSASSEIVKAPKHIRLGNKDYILVAEKSGKLNILSRQGDIRVPLNQTIEFSENEWYGHDGKFVSTAPTNELIEISQQGKVSEKNLELAENNRMVANNTHLVYLNENLLNINGKAINLDFGLYTDPQLFQFRKRTLIALTDIQTKKVYVFDQNAELLEGFPVYGSSKVDIANANLDSRLELVVKGEDNEILLYKL